MGHRLSLAARTQISVCKLPFPSTGTKVSLFRTKTVQLKGHSGAELHIYFLVRLESIYYQIFFYSKIVPNCAVAK